MQDHRDFERSSCVVVVRVWLLASKAAQEEGSTTPIGCLSHHQRKPVSRHAAEDSSFAWTVVWSHVIVPLADTVVAVW